MSSVFDIWPGKASLPVCPSFRLILQCEQSDSWQIRPLPTNITSALKSCGIACGQDTIQHNASKQARHSGVGWRVFVWCERLMLQFHSTMTEGGDQEPTVKVESVGVHLPVRASMQGWNTICQQRGQQRGPRSPESVKCDRIRRIRTKKQSDEVWVTWNITHTCVDIMHPEEHFWCADCISDLFVPVCLSSTKQSGFGMCVCCLYICVRTEKQT